MAEFDAVTMGVCCVSRIYYMYHQRLVVLAARDGGATLHLAVVAAMML
jgi:hypothetical protein